MTVEPRRFSCESSSSRLDLRIQRVKLHQRGEFNSRIRNDGGVIHLNNLSRVSTSGKNVDPDRDWLTYGNLIAIDLVDLNLEVIRRIVDKLNRNI